jgi:uncharacterized protein
MPAFEDIPLVDGHLHPPLRNPDAHPFVRFFSEASDGAFLDRHGPQSLFYRRSIRELAGLLNCEAEADAVERARRDKGLEAYFRLVTSSANVESLLIDDGYPPEGALAIDECSRLAGCDARRVLRLERALEELLPVVESAQDLADGLIDRIASGPRPAALKSIIAYRAGLAVSEPDRHALALAFAETKAKSQSGSVRLQSKALLNFCLLRALEWASEARLPVQFHTGYGDRDIDLIQANPALLKPLLEDRRLQDLQIVLLHASYPYVREAAYLASVYPQVYVDWSQANPMLAPAELRAVLQQLLSLAPYTKLLYGSDAWGIPDWIYLGARAGRAALAAALEDEPGALAVDIARRVLRDNARELYALTE